MIFLDTSILIAVAQVSHARHTASLEVWNSCRRKDSAIGAHTLAELYNCLTGMPPPLRIRPRDAALAIETFLRRLTPIVLTAEDYQDALSRAARLGIAGGMIYDLLLLQCARKCRASKIYTWNLQHFRAAAPDLSERIATP
ncbi:MAG: type II toxin-antitoxin system VapC family toxin [Acidobacteriota bacterium]